MGDHIPFTISGTFKGLGVGVPEIFVARTYIPIRPYRMFFCSSAIEAIDIVDLQVGTRCVMPSAGTRVSATKYGRAPGERLDLGRVEPMHEVMIWLALKDLPRFSIVLPSGGIPFSAEWTATTLPRRELGIAGAGGPETDVGEDLGDESFGSRIDGIAAVAGRPGLTRRDPCVGFGWDPYGD